MQNCPLLSKLTSPADLKTMSGEELDALAKEIRQTILTVVSRNGGHLASNLGVVEATLALHRVFSFPGDRLIFDVGHQCYAHKILTGRYAAFSTLRRKDGLSGFQKPEESEYDPFGAGHCGTAVSAALGFAHADILSASDSWTVAFVGDGSFTNGMVSEALNNCSDKRLRLIIVLNENDMSISPNVGAISRYLSRMRVSQGYFSFKHRLQKCLKKIPLAGNALIRFSRACKNRVKRFVLSGNYFEHLGVNYLGPVDGNDRKKIESVLAEAKTREGCTLVHICTKKGKGYPPAEEFPERYHSVSPFDPDKGVLSTGKETFSSRFGRLLTERAASDPKLCAVTAAMTGGTGLSPFEERFPDRFFDVGIAEEHALTFAAGLSAAGLRPVFAVYSTFAQRIYDQVLHDSLLQRFPLTLCLDRAGLVPGDGPTHQGIFDVSLFLPLGIRIHCPACLSDLERCLDRALAEKDLSILRYPRGSGEEPDLSAFVEKDGYRVLGEGKKVAVTYGRLTSPLSEAAKKTGTKLISLLVLPPDPDALFAEIGGAETLFLVEEGIYGGGVCELIASEAAIRRCPAKIKIRTLPVLSPYKGNERELFSAFSLDADSLTGWLSEGETR